MTRPVAKELNDGRTGGPDAEAGAEKPKKRIGLSKLLLIALALIIAYCCVFSLAVKVIRSEPIPMPLGFGVAVVLTGSMEPTLKENDLVIVTRAGEYSVGDIVVYSTGGTPVIHRIVELDEESGVAVMKGDANNAPDGPITVSRIKGRMALRVPAVGAVFRFIKTVPGIVMILILLFTLFYLSVRAREEDGEADDKADDIKKQIAELREELGGADPGDIRAELAEKEAEIQRLRRQLGLETENENKADHPAPEGPENKE